MILTDGVTSGSFVGAMNVWGGCDMDYTQSNVGCLNGQTMIEMNNLAVGYFPSDMPEIGFYPPPATYPETIEAPQDSEKNL